MTNAPFQALEENGPFQRDTVPIPISFDRVLEHRAPKSTSAFLRVPIEILGLILGYADSPSLAALALVNSDCRQLARSRQFADVCLDYSESSEALVRLLVSEAGERRMNNGSTSLPSLGACIRRLTVSIDTNTIRQRFNTRKTAFSENEGHGLTLIEAGQPEWQAIFTTITEAYLPLV
jgi:hypothetical protein